MTSVNNDNNNSYVRLFSFLYSIIDIGHLQLIRDILKDSHFDDTKWFDLGLSLKLQYNDLNIFRKTSYADDASRCLMECLALWLKSGPITSQVLVNALRDVGQNNASESVRKICKYVIILL